MATRHRRSADRSRHLALASFMTATLLAGLAGTATAGAAVAGRPRAATGRAWVVQHPANPGGATTLTLNGISCTSPRQCIAVGDYGTGSIGDNSEETTATLAERWNGALWARQPTPNPPGSVQSTLAGVACPSSRQCQAVGYELTNGNDSVPLAENWNGRVWAIEPLPAVGPPGVSFLFNVSCPSALSCVAVGYDDNDEGTAQVLAERWNGTAWAVLPTTGAAAPGSFFDVSCPSPADCIAVGTANSGAPLAERWNGTRWSVLAPVGVPGAFDVTLGSIACATASDCIAGAYYVTQSFSFIPITEAWNGTRWRKLPSPAPPHSSGSFINAISCGSPTACLGVGSYSDAQGATQTLAATWNGARWATVPGSGPGSLAAVSCTGASSCTAAGSSPGGPTSGTWNGRSWVGHPFPPIADATETGLNGVSCDSVLTCVGVGFYWSDGSVEPLAERWQAGKWAVLQTPDPHGSKNTVLNAVSCPSATMCAAVGSYVVSNPFEQPLTEIWNGTGWAIEPAASPGHGASEVTLQTVSCASAMWCVAAGSYQNNAGIEKTLTEVWNGSGWAFVPSPNPAGEEVSFLSGVSCRSAASCMAVGYWSSIRQVLHTLAEAWNGTTWVIEPTPTSGGDTDDMLTSVSCPTTAECIAVGNSSGTPVAEGWNGSSWTVQPTPKLSGYLAGVSCPAAASCVAAGTTAGATLAEGWDGSSWTVQATPALPGDGSFAAVSCPVAGTCTAAGQTTNAAGTPVMLAERHRLTR